MKKYIQKFLYIGLLVAVMTLIMSSLAYAGDAATNYQKKLDDIASQVKGYAELIIVISALFTSILYMMSFANPGNKEWAKKSLYALVVGVLMLVLYTNIAGWIYTLLGKSPDGLPASMNINDKIKTVNGDPVDKYNNSNSNSSSAVDPLYGATPTPTITITPDGKGYTMPNGMIANHLPSGDIKAPNTNFSDFVGKPITLTATDIQHYSENNQLKYLSDEQLKTARDMIQPIMGQSDEWRSIGINLGNMVVDGKSGPGVIPDYGALQVNLYTTIQKAYDFDDLDKFPTDKLMNAHELIVTDKDWFPPTVTNPTIFTYKGRIAIKVNDILKSRGAIK